MRKDKLIQLWMANGFIPSRPHMDLHDVGCEIFNELTQRSFFMDVKEAVDGDILCKMHDLIHDLALSIARDECFLIESSEEVEVLKHVHHLSICQSYPRQHDTPLKLDLRKIPQIRSLVSFHHSNVILFPSSFKSKFLRTLDLHSMLDLRKSHVIHGYKHLRYLDLSFSGIKVLPNSVSCLHNVQTINLKHCYQLEMLRKDLGHLKDLVYLDIRGCYNLACLPVRIGKLVHLRKLGIFIVGTKIGYRIIELQALDLGGELSIKELGNVKSTTEARSANLIRKQNLRSLELHWNNKNSTNNVHEKVEDVLSGLQPHPNLKKLVIKGFQGVKLPFWIMESLLPNLVEISLQLERYENLPPLGKLIFLKVLSIRSNSVQYIGPELYGDSGDSFPSLEEMSITGNTLKEWKTMEGKENFPRLRKLIFECCPQLSEIPVVPSLKDLKVCDCSLSLLNALQSFTFLTSLRVFYVDNLPNKCLWGFTLLENLHIAGSSLKSVSIQFDSLCALRTLRLDACKNQVSLPPDAFCSLSSLSTLSINNCDKLSSLPSSWQHLTALEYLNINGCPELLLLPDSLCYLTTLRHLSIACCKGLTALPLEISQLTSLSTLTLIYCPSLRCLPEGFQNLTMLGSLRIEACPHLEMRCNRERGADWPKIAHIPDIVITK